MKVEAWDPDKNDFVPWVFKPTGSKEYYWLTADLNDDPMSVAGGEEHFSTLEEARTKGLEALAKKEEGTLEIWWHHSDVHGNGESGVEEEYRREKVGLSATIKVL